MFPFNPPPPAPAKNIEEFVSSKQKFGRKVGRNPQNYERLCAALFLLSLEKPTSLPVWGGCVKPGREAVTRAELQGRAAPGVQARHGGPQLHPARAWQALARPRLLPRGKRRRNLLGETWNLPTAGLPGCQGCCQDGRSNLGHENFLNTPKSP